MVDLSCKTSKCIDNHQIWNKTPDSRVSKGERTHRGVKRSEYTKKIQVVFDLIIDMGLGLVLVTTHRFALRARSIKCYALEVLFLYSSATHYF